MLMTKDFEIVITCSKCRHRNLLSLNGFKALLAKLSISLSDLGKESLIEGAKKLKCSSCGAKSAKITKQTAQENKKANPSQRVGTCTVCQRAFELPKVALRSQIGLCPQCQSSKSTIDNAKWVAPRSVPQSRPRARFIDNLPPGGIVKKETSMPALRKHTNKYDIPDYEEGSPRPGWCTDSDWRKMRGRQLTDMKKRHRGD